MVLPPGSDQRSWTTDSSPGVATGLEQGKSYRISVSAVNWMGEGPRSDPASDAIIPATTPDGVENLSVVAGDMNITVTWSPPKDHGGANVTSYTVWITASDAAISLPEPVIVTAKPGVSSYSVSFGDGGESQLLESNWIHHTDPCCSNESSRARTYRRSGRCLCFMGFAHGKRHSSCYLYWAWWCPCYGFGR